MSIIDGDTGAGDDIQVTACPDGSFCEGVQNDVCCVSGQGVFVVNGNEIVAAKTSTSSSTSTSPTSTSTSSQPPRTTTSQPTTTSTGAASTTTGSSSAISSTPTSSPSGLSTGAKAGIGVGVALGALAILGVLIWVIMRRRRTKAQAYNDGRTAAPPVGQSQDVGRGPAEKPFGMNEGFSDRNLPPMEMPATQPPQYRSGMAELEGRA